ncbi:jg4230 [Pararge aegeria aegeria]|uniref:Jg4230 protein n=1 Tax=Pararge aegeria aegeria TaxID=348720 RepID=A0A8S4RSD7_9NEOP|nr:jg4230 [Pararge aegeria aegeria]
MDVGVPRCWNGSPVLVSAALVDPQRGGQTTLSASQVAVGSKRLRIEELGTPYKRPMSSSGRLSVDLMSYHHNYKEVPLSDIAFRYDAAWKPSGLIQGCYKSNRYRDYDIPNTRHRPPLIEVRALIHECVSPPSLSITVQLSLSLPFPRAS